MGEDKKFAEIMKDIANEKAILDNKYVEMLKTIKKNEETVKTITNARVKLQNFLTFLNKKINREIKFNCKYPLWIEDSQIMAWGIIKHGKDLYLKGEKDNELKILTPLYYYNLKDIRVLYDFFVQIKDIIFENTEDTITELCPTCETEVMIPNIFDVHICPNCGNPILPCGICKDKNCTECPLMVKQLATFQKLAVEKYYNK